MKISLKILVTFCISVMILANMNTATFAKTDSLFYNSPAIEKSNFMTNIKVENFSVSKEEVSQGESVLISWNVPNASNVNIIGLTDKDLPPDGVIEVTPSETTTYVLVATGFDWSFAIEKVTVKVS